jgi:hypothetical protein
MKNSTISLIAILTFLFVSGLAAAEPSPNSRVPVIVELFTSEGCSSCPPADRLLAKLIEKQPVAKVEIIGMEHHVDYWDRLGWRDPFSSGALTVRQSEYGGAFRLRSIYTPQMVVDGILQFVGSERGDALDAIAKAARQPKANVSLAVLLSAAEGRDRRLTFWAEARDVPEEVQSEQLEVVLAILEDGLASDVSRGENRGKLLRHRGVTRHFATIGTMNSGGAPTFSHKGSVVLDPSWRVENLKAVVFLQAETSRRIIGASSVALVGSGLAIRDE